MSLDQVVYYYNIGWQTKKSDAKINSSYDVLLQNGKDPDNPDADIGQPRKKSKEQLLEEYRQYPEYKNCYFDDNGKFHKE
jgi:hypothetical protein